jgi:hypothetical protein
MKLILFIKTTSNGIFNKIKNTWKINSTRIIEYPKKRYFYGKIVGL